MLNADQLDLPACDLKVKRDPQGDLVFDAVRRKYVRITPEEWVRQHFIHFLVNELHCPLSLLSVEHSISMNGMSKRADVVIHGADGAPVALVECKAPKVKLTQAAFDQAARYNKVFRVRYLMVTNGMKHFSCQVDHVSGEVVFMNSFPTYLELSAPNSNTP